MKNYAQLRQRRHEEYARHQRNLLVLESIAITAGTIFMILALSVIVIIAKS